MHTWDEIINTCNEERREKWQDPNLLLSCFLQNFSVVVGDSRGHKQKQNNDSHHDSHFPSVAIRLAQVLPDYLFRIWCVIDLDWVGFIQFLVIQGESVLAFEKEPVPDLRRQLHAVVADEQIFIFAMFQGNNSWICLHLFILGFENLFEHTL